MWLSSVFLLTSVGCAVRISSVLCVDRAEWISSAVAAPEERREDIAPPLLSGLSGRARTADVEAELLDFESMRTLWWLSATLASLRKWAKALEFLRRSWFVNFLTSLCTSDRDPEPSLQALVRERSCSTWLKTAFPAVERMEDPRIAPIVLTSCRKARLGSDVSAVGEGSLKSLCVGGGGGGGGGGARELMLGVCVCVCVCVCACVCCVYVYYGNICKHLDVVWT